MRDHGGNLDWAMARWGGRADDWIDLSTGINPTAFPMPEVALCDWADLPTKTRLRELCAAARTAYGARREILPVAGAQAAIQMIPWAMKIPDFPRLARVLGPTYNEHAASFAAAGWAVEVVDELSELAGAGAAVVVNPNNPDGRVCAKADLLALASNVGVLVVDESFADPTPGISLAGEEVSNILILRSFGKFYGLAGLRLGFVLGAMERVHPLAAFAGPWPVSGPAIVAGCAGLSDRAWQRKTAQRLRGDALKLDGLAARRGWALVGGTDLFRLYQTPDCMAAQMELAEHRIWSRVFPYSDRWIRLGLPDRDAWSKLEVAI